MGFYNAMKNEFIESDANFSVTENGAVGYRSTGKSLLDINFAVASLRSTTDQQIIEKFKQAFFEDKLLAVKWLFFARDCRGGLGERRLFRIVLNYLAEYDPESTARLIPLIAEYGRYDDIWGLLITLPVLREAVIEYVRVMISEDMKNLSNGNPISLLGKWMPSENASSVNSLIFAQILRKGLGMSSAQYRKTLSKLRKYLDIVESKMSSGQWDEINYEAVPSRANLIYNDAFLRNDEERRRAFLSALDKGEAKINASVLYPHDIVHKYSECGYYREHLREYDAALEALWRELPDTVSGCENTIVVADGSGSMCCSVGNTKVTALEVANALAIYFAERSSGEFKNKYITFSKHPQLVDLGKENTLKDKIEIALAHDECSNTNIEAVFDLILNTAIKNHMRQEDVPANVLIISDMEFDSCAVCNSGNDRRGYYYNNRFIFQDARVSAPLFRTIEQKYHEAGYKLPRLVFWNVNSRTGTIPVHENDMGVALVSGFSVNICKMVMSGKLDPYECLLETINAERYRAVEDAWKNCERRG